MPFLHKLLHPLSLIINYLGEKIVGKSQLGVRLPDELIERLNKYVAENKTSKTDVVIGALAQYLDSPESVPLGERVTSVEERLSEVEAALKKMGIDN